MKLRIDEIYIEGVRHTIKYDKKYANGWYLQGGFSGDYGELMMMKALKNSPRKKDKAAYKEWRADRALSIKQKLMAVQKVLDAIESIEDEGPLTCLDCGSTNLEIADNDNLGSHICLDCVARLDKEEE